MGEPEKLMEKLFFEVFEPLPRQGPGSRSSAKRAFDLCSLLPKSPDILDLGCGSGGQSFHLAGLTTGSILAIDNHAPSIKRLQAEAIERGLGHRIKAEVGDIARTSLKPESFDLIWSEGALYYIGIAKALSLYQSILRPSGYFAFTEAVWLKDNPPPKVKAAFKDYATMGGVPDVLAKIKASPLALVGHFTLPKEDWWGNFYAPMQRRISELRAKYTGDAKAVAVLGEIAQEPKMHREYSDFYGYQLFVVQKEVG